ERVSRGGHYAPHDVLGAHPGHGRVVIRVIRHLATKVLIHVDGEVFPAAHEHNGIWVAHIDSSEIPTYEVEAFYADGAQHRQYDGYQFLPTLGEVDLHLIAEGRHEQLWNVLGAHY